MGNALKELYHTILDAIEIGDLSGHLASWWRVITGRVDPRDPAGWPARR